MGLLFSCNSGSNKFSMIESKGLYADNLGLNTVLFCNKDTGFIAGSSDKVTHNPNESSDTFAFVNSKALLYKTIDGGITWIVKDFGEGSFKNIVSVKKSIYAFKINEKTFYTEIYYSNDFGESWKIETSFPNVVTDLFFINNLIVLIGKDENRVFQFYISNDEGQHWIKNITSYTPIYDVAVVDKKLLYLSSNIQDGYRKNLLVNYNVVDGTSKVMELPKEFDCYFLTNNDNQIKLCGKQDNHIAVYNLKNEKLQYEYSTPEKDSMIFPVGFYNAKNEDYIVVGRRRSNDVEHNILKTVNSGKDWETINFERDNLITPFCFINNDNEKVKAWFFAGSGKFQILQ